MRSGASASVEKKPPLWLSQKSEIWVSDQEFKRVSYLAIGKGMHAYSGDDPQTQDNSR